MRFPALAPGVLKSAGCPESGQTETPGTDELAPDVISQTAPLTYHQERLWFIDEFERDRVYSGPPTYHNIPVLLRILGKVDTGALEAAIDLLIARHEALRTRIQQQQQRVYLRQSFHLAIISVAGLPVDQVIALALDENRTPFLLERDFLFRAALYRLGAEDALLALTVHHIVADLWSAQILAEDLIEFYRAQISGTPPALPAQSSGFCAYSIWQRSLPPGAFNSWLPFWKWQLQSDLMPLELPYRQARHPIHIYSSGIQEFTIEPDLVETLGLLAKETSAGLSDVMLAGFVAVLHACSRQNEILAGMTYPNRDRDTRHMVGPVANLLVLRFRLDEAWSFTELLRHIQRVVRQAIANSAIPFDLLVQRLNPPKDMSRTALFDVLYQFLDEDPHSWSIPDGTIRRADSFIGFGKYDLNLTLRRRDTSILGFLEFNQELFHKQFIEDLLTLLLSVLRSAAQNASATLAHHVRLPSPLVQQQRALLSVETGLHPHFPTLDTAFDAAWQHWPDSAAIVVEGAHFTYKAIADLSYRISRMLLNSGVRPGIPVMLFLERSPEAISAILGILRLGAWYIPVDPEYPPLRIAMLIEDSGSAFVVTTAALSGVFASYTKERAIRVIEIEACGSASAAALNSRSTADDVVYSIYTSGSTGRPKGCLVQHRNVVQLILSQAAAFAFGEHDVWTWSHSLCFDFSVWEIFGTLLYGGRGVVLSEDAVRDPEMVQHELEREQVTVLNQTPAVGLRLTEHLLASNASTPSLRSLIFGGDVLKPGKLADWSTTNPHVAIVNMYGITETTVHVTRKVLDATEISKDSRSVGRALPNAALYILGNNFDLLPTGVLGEIGVTGSGVSLGYWKRPDMTAQRFVPDSFSGCRGGRMYRSGDLARLLPSGEIDFHGRCDNQVKIRGYRIELDEIEKTLMDFPGVAESALIIRNDTHGDKMLVAFVTSMERSIDPDTLRAYLQKRLAASMIPSVIQPIKVLPRTASGKVDRKALSDLTLHLNDQNCGYVPPRNQTERILAGIWEEVLGRDRIGIHDDFFKIGGDSILSIQICARAKRAGLPLTPKLLFQHSNIEELSREFDHISAPVNTGSTISEAPLLPVQEWFFAQAHPEPNHFNQSAWFALADGVNEQDLKEAFVFLRERHVALRLAFVRENERILQRDIKPPAEFPFTTLSLNGISAKQHQDAITKAAAELQGRLDIQSGPLFGAMHLEPASGQPGKLLIVFHHLIVDAVSWRTLLEDLDLFLDHRLKASPLDLCPSSSLLAYAAEFSGRMGKNGGGKVQCFASRKNVTPLPENTFAHYQQFETAYDETLTQAIADTLVRENLGWEEALLAGAAHAAFESSENEVEEIFFEAHGRDINGGMSDPSHAVGWFMKMYKISLPRPRGTVISFLHAIKRDVARAKANPDLLERWYEEKRAGTDESEFLRPGICVNFLGQFDALLRASNWLRFCDGETGPSIASGNYRFHLVDVNAFIVRGQLCVRWGYCEALQQINAIEKLASACSGFLRSLVAGNPDVEPDFPEKHDFEAHLLAPGQVGMLYRALLNPAAAHEYVISSVLRIEGSLNIDIFRRSWAVLLERHEGLRAYFEWDGIEGPAQRFAGDVMLPLNVLDWRNVESAQIKARLESWVQETAARGFNLSIAPLLRLDIVQTCQEETFVLLQMHHLIVDGWSLAILRDELLRIYISLLSETRYALKVPGSFREYLRFLKQQNGVAAQAFWKRRLQGVYACALPQASQVKDKANPVAESYSLDVMKRPLDRNLGWARWAAQNHITLNTVMQGLWSLVLGILTERSSVVAGVVVAGRPEALPQMEHAVGNFINTLPLPVELSSSLSIDLWLKKLQEEFVDSQQFQYCSLAEICAAAGLPADRPLFDTALVCENYLNPKPLRLEGLSIQEISYSIKESIPIVVEYSFSEALVCRLRYRPDLVSTALIGEAAELLQIGFEWLDKKDPASQVAELSLALKEHVESRRRDRETELASHRQALLKDFALGRRKHSQL